MTKRLPKGWVETTLSGVTLPVESVRPEISPDVEFTYFDIGGIDNQRAKIASTQRILGRDAPSRARQAAKLGDILFSTVRTYLRNIAMIDREYTNPVASTGFTVIRSGPGVVPEFVFHQVLSESFLQPLNEMQTGTSYPAVRDRDVLAQKVRLAPTPEQERIVAKLDATFARLDAGEAALRRGKERMKRYRAAVLNAAVTGELTKEWRKTNPSEETGAQLLKRLLIERRKKWEAAELAKMREKGRAPKDDKWKDRYPEPQAPDAANLPRLPKGWTWATVEQLGFVIGGLTKNPKRGQFPLKLPYLRVANVYANELRLDDVAEIGVEDGELDKLLLEEGDLLVVEGNGSKDQIGRVAIWDGSIRQCAHQNHIIKVRLVERGAAKWILYWLLSGAGRHHIEQVASSTSGLYTLSVSKAGSLPVRLPPLAEQQMIIRALESCLSAADRLAAALDRQLASIRRQRQAILRDAFAGKLVPQDSSDEPASTLLGRIRQDAGAKRGVLCSRA